MQKNETVKSARQVQKSFNRITAETGTPAIAPNILFSHLCKHENQGVLASVGIAVSALDSQLNFSSWFRACLNAFAGCHNKTSIRKFRAYTIYALLKLTATKP
jgi:hypothetical protein